MNYSEPLISQVTVFFRSVGAGIILGIIYDALSFVRIVFGERKSVYVTADIIFSLIASVFSFFFMVLYNTGQVRFNLMLGELAGGLAFHFGMGKYFLNTAEKYILKIRKVLMLIMSPFRKILLKIKDKIKEEIKKHRKTEKQLKITEKLRKIFINIRKSPLQNSNKSV